jgi:chaperonin GroES
VKIAPLYSHVVIRKADPDAKSPGGIVLPESVRAGSNGHVRGAVLAAGPGRIAADGSLAPLSVKVDDAVLYSPANAHAIAWDGEEPGRVVVVQESAIVGVVEP